MSQIVNTNDTINVEQLSAEAKAQIKAAILEVNDSLVRIASEQDLMKETIDGISDELGVDKRLIRRIAKVYYKNKIQEEKDANATFEEFYDGIMK